MSLRQDLAIVQDVAGWSDAELLGIVLDAVEKGRDVLWYVTDVAEGQGGSS